MIRPVATVVTARAWEAALVRAARLGGGARVAARCTGPWQVDEALRYVEAVVVGAETPWLTEATLARWRAAGALVVGVHCDPPGQSLLLRGRCDLVLPDHTPPLELLARLAVLPPPKGSPRPAARRFLVTGPRGAPGRTEVAIALAWALAESGSTLLAELDAEAPTLGLRLGIPPGTPREGPSLHHLDRVDLLVLPPGGPLAFSLTARLLETARLRYRAMVLDVGPPGNATTTGADETVLVCEGSPLGSVRAARLAASWGGPVPRLVVNRVPREPARRAVALTTVRRAVGLEPEAVIDRLDPPPWGRAPAEPMVAALRVLAGPPPEASALAWDLSQAPPGSCRGTAGPPG